MSSPAPVLSDSPGIHVRRPLKPLSRDLPRYWYSGEAFATHFLDALSSIFPFGEAFFVRSVLHYRDQIEDPELREDIGGFAAQESHHSRIHNDHVKLLVDQGYTGIASFNRNGDGWMRRLNRHLPKTSLAMTAALEHLTAILARQILTRPDCFTEKMHPQMAALWRWHALEEAEHKSVAFDVMRIMDTPRWLLVLVQIINTTSLSIDVFVRLVYMLGKDGLLFSRAGWRGGFRFLFGKQGFLRGIGAEYLAWFRRDFHPEDTDDGPLISLREPAITREMATVH